MPVRRDEHAELRLRHLSSHSIALPPFLSPGNVKLSARVLHQAIHHQGRTGCQSCRPVTHNGRQDCRGMPILTCFYINPQPSGAGKRPYRVCLAAGRRAHHQSGCLGASAWGRRRNADQPAHLPRNFLDARTGTPCLPLLTGDRRGPRPLKRDSPTLATPAACRPRYGSHQSSGR